MGIGILFLLMAAYYPSWFDVFLVVGGSLSVLLFFATTLPGKSGGFYSDRKRFQRLMSKGETGRCELAVIQTINQKFIDGSYDQVSSDWLQTMQGSSEPEMQFWGRFFHAHQIRDSTQQPVDEAVIGRLEAYRPYFSKPVWEGLDINALTRPLG